MNELRVPAIEVRKGNDYALYTLAIDGKVVSSFATVSRVRRTEGGDLEGYQRPEVRKHIDEIRAYVETADALLPNAIVLAFDRRVRFEPGVIDPTAIGPGLPGTLIIPIDPSLPPERRPGFVVDGQQRLAAIRDANIDSFPICLAAFITDEPRRQVEQFILVNSSKPLAKSLIYQLLPDTHTRFPALYARRRFPAYLLDRLNRDNDSPLHGKIQTPTSPEGIVKDNSILKMLENSLSDGVLYRYHQSDGQEQAEPLLELLKDFWGAVSQVFADAWGLPPRRSRLMHGAGIVSLGFLMDTIADRHRDGVSLSLRTFANDLRPLKPLCRWTDGYWDFGPGQQRRWNELQNTHSDIQLLTNYLLVQYKSRVWNGDALPAQ